MSQPPYPPEGGDEPWGDRPGAHGRDQPGSPDDPTRRLDAPAGWGQRDQTRQFGQGGPYGQQYGQAWPPGYGRPPDQPEYGPTAGEHQYAQPQYAQPQYGQHQYGQPQYGVPPYGQPWGPPVVPGGQEPKKNSNLLVSLVVAAVVVLAAAATGLFFLFGGSDPAPDAAPTAAPPSVAEAPEPAQPSVGSGATSESSTEGDAVPPATVPPEGLGDDPAMDQLARGCYDGDMRACDDLYRQSDADSRYELYGGTCAGRQDVSVSDSVYCTSAFPGR